MSTVNKCIKESKPIELTLNDCLSCSGCITTSEKSDLMQSDLTKLINSPKNKSFLISPFSKLNTYNHFITKGYKLTFNDFELYLTHFFIKNNCKILDTSFYLNDILTNLKKEFLQTNKLIVSDCPGTVKYIERNGHHLVDWLSKVYSPQEISVTQNNNTLPIVSVIPCLDKKLEKIKVDYYLTTKEFFDFLECNNFTFDKKIRLEKNKSNFKNSFSGGYTQFMLHELKDEFVLEEKGKGFLVYKSEKYALYQVYGLRNLLNFINLTRKGLEFSFAEIFLCENACVNGPARAKLSLQNEIDVIYQSVSDNNTIGLNCFGKQFEVKKIRKVNFKVEW